MIWHRRSAHAADWVVRVSVALACLCALVSGPTQAQSCNIGTYRLNDGQIVDVGASDDDTLRWRRLDGETGALRRAGDSWTSTLGWTGRADGITVRFSDCNSIQFGDAKGQRVALVMRDTTFVSHGTTLVGRLVLPEGGAAGTIVVLLQGSERDSARAFDPLQRILPALGVGAFVYDKRGTGASGAAYTQDFWLLADDAVAALNETKRLGGNARGRVGYLGPSQGGWVAPIAATHSAADFVISTFGLAVSVLDEDREAIELEMHLKGHSEAQIARALEIADTVGIVFASGFTEGLDEFDAVRTRYRNEAWYPDLHGNFTHFFLDKSVDDIRASAAQFRWQTPFRYDPIPTIAWVRAPQLWVLGGQDLDAPSAETARRLGSLMKAHHPITTALYPRAEHGMTEFEIAPDGSRRSTRYAHDYFQLIADFARAGRVDRAYGDAQMKRPR